VKVALIMGSDSDWDTMEPAEEVLRDFGIETEVVVASAHRTPDRVQSFAQGAEQRGVRVIIAAAGAAAHLPGVVAAYTTLPVVGVPVNATSLGGMDALLSIVQMPAGIPVACMAINGAKNAGLFAVEILATTNKPLRAKLLEYRVTMAAQVERKAQKLEEKLQKQ
jgi:5-(carboxyamino)imidazole ribonucleotide mutase